jgi:hypothetical protein
VNGYLPCFAMESAAVVTVADLRSRSIQNWVQDVVNCYKFRLTKKL